MGRREFYAWVKQVHIETSPEQQSPHSWKGTDDDDWWHQARERRKRIQGR